MIKLEINFPSTKEEYHNIWKKIKFWVWGFRCDSCSTRMFYTHPKLEAYTHKKRFIGSTFGKIHLCPQCLLEELLARDVFHDENTCDWCESKAGETVAWFNEPGADLSFTFGSGWWNGHHICKDCLKQSLENLTDVNSDHSKYNPKDKKSYYVNSLGIMDKRKNRGAI